MSLVLSSAPPAAAPSDLHTVTSAWPVAIPAARSEISPFHPSASRGRSACQQSFHWHSARCRTAERCMLISFRHLKDPASEVLVHWRTALSGCWAQHESVAHSARQHMPQPPETAPAQTDGSNAADGSASGRADDATTAAPAQGNVLPWRRRKAFPPGQQQQKADNRILLLFDLNGTLTSHTSKRRSAGINRMRPGLQHLQRLQGLFQLGIFTSASDRTVNSVIPMLHNAIGQPAFRDASLVLTRQETEQAPVHHITNGGNAWDTVKPLQKHFGSRIHRIVLIDDDAYKACPGEERNMVLVPRWDENDDDDLVARLVDALLLVLGPLDDRADVRDFVPQTSAALTGHTAAAVLAAA